MRTRKHYDDLLSKNTNTTIGFTLAAQAVYAAKNGVFDHNADDFNNDEYRDIARALKQKYGENLSTSEVRREMENFSQTGAMITRNIPRDLQREFKSRCAAEGISQQGKIVQLMREYIK